MKTYPALREFAAPQSMSDLPTAEEENGIHSSGEAKTSRRKKKSAASEEQQELPL
jgi:hypothetical protein